MFLHTRLHNPKCFLCGGWCWVLGLGGQPSPCFSYVMWQGKSGSSLVLVMYGGSVFIFAFVFWTIKGPIFFNLIPFLFPVILGVLVSMCNLSIFTFLLFSLLFPLPYLLASFLLFRLVNFCNLGGSLLVPFFFIIFNKPLLHFPVLFGWTEVHLIKHTGFPSHGLFGIKTFAPLCRSPVMCCCFPFPF